MPAGAREPRCLFCGSKALVPVPAPEGVEIPGTFTSFELDQKGADAAFRKKARSSIWYPGDLRRAKLEIEKLLLPAWVWAGVVETHWAALVRAATSSGKRPITGSDQARLSGVLVPSSSALSRDELRAIAPFKQRNVFLFRAHEAPAPFELGKLTRSMARDQACEALAENHRNRIAIEVKAAAIRGSHLFSELDGEPLLLPVYIGAYRRRGKLYRLVINGQSGKLTGEFPISWAKVGCAALLVTAVLVGLALMTAIIVYLASI